MHSLGCTEARGQSSCHGADASKGATEIAHMGKTTQRVNGKEDGSDTSNDSSPAGEAGQQVDGRAGGKTDREQANDGRGPSKADPPPMAMGTL